MRLVVIGPPLSGKTTYAVSQAARMQCPVHHCDDLISTHDWSAASQHIADEWLGKIGPWIVEGVAAVRGLRKWLKQNPEGKPCDMVLYIKTPKIPLNAGQARMQVAIDTIWRQIAADLRGRGVDIGVE